MAPILPCLRRGLLGMKRVMRPFTTLARPFVAAPYIMTGLDAIRDPRERAERVGPAVKPVADRIEWLPKDPETLVRMEGALSLGTGALLLTGRFRRLTTLLLAAQLVPALTTEHRFWTEDDPERRASERAHLLKNAGLFGALLMVATEPRRPPRTAELRRAVRETQITKNAEAKALRREAAATLREARREAARQVRVARAEGGRKAAKRTAKAGGALTAGRALKGRAIKGRTPGRLSSRTSGGAMKGLKAGSAKVRGVKSGGVKSGGVKSGGVKAGAALGLARALKLAKPSKPGRAARAVNAGRTVKAGTTAQAAKAVKAGKTVKAGTATQAAKAVKAGKTVRAGTAVQAGKVKHAVKR